MNITGKIRELYYKSLVKYDKRKERLASTGIFCYVTNTSGYILVIVLIITSLLISISTEFFITAQTNMNYINKFDERIQAHILAKSGINLAVFILDADRKGWAQMLLGQDSGDKNIDSYDDIWAMDFPMIPLYEKDPGMLKVKIDDQNSKINLSFLTNEFGTPTTYYNITWNFFADMGLPLDIVDAIRDWVDKDDSISPYGAESSDYYQTLETPYEAKNGAMDSINELLLVKGMTPEIFYGLGGGTMGVEENLVEHNKGNRNMDAGMLEELDPENMFSALSGGGETGTDMSDLDTNYAKEKSRRLDEYFRVYGEQSGNIYGELNKININTAPYRVLQALPLTPETPDDIMTDDILVELFSRRPFKKIADVQDLITNEFLRQKCLSVKSQIFKITSIGIYNNTSVKIESIYYRDGKRFYYWSVQ